MNSIFISVNAADFYTTLNIFIILYKSWTKTIMLKRNWNKSFINLHWKFGFVSCFAYSIVWDSFGLAVFIGNIFTLTFVIVRTTRVSRILSVSHSMKTLGILLIPSRCSKIEGNTFGHYNSFDSPILYSLRTNLFRQKDFTNNFSFNHGSKVFAANNIIQKRRQLGCTCILSKFV